MSGIELKDITKRFGNVYALDKIKVSFQENKIYGLLGRNGAGKSTLLNIITNRLFADSGEVLIDGIPIGEEEALHKVYLMSEKNLYPEGMKISEVYKWTKEFYPDFEEESAKKIADQFNLDIRKKVKTLSTGYASIFKLTVVLAVHTPYLLLDEPVLGLDANHRELFYRLLLETYTAYPCSIVISTHLIEEIAGLLEEVVIIKKGKIIKNESCESLLSQGYTISGKASLVEKYIADKHIVGSESMGGLKIAYILGKRENKIPEGLEVTKLDLQKLFIQLTDS